MKNPLWEMTEKRKKGILCVACEEAYQELKKKSQFILLEVKCHYMIGSVSILGRRCLNGKLPFRSEKTS